MWSVVILVSIGVLMAVPPTVAQLNGAGRRGEIGAVFRQALWLALALGLGLFFVVRGGALALAPMGITAEARPEAEAFLRAISWGAPALALYFCLRNLSEGIAWTKPTMVFGIADGNCGEAVDAYYDTNALTSVVYDDGRQRPMRKPRRDRE